jgi:diaminopimelate epimerase
MTLRFTKMHGLGNDFVVFNTLDQSVALTPEICRRLADRRLGIGCDQILLVERPRIPGTDFHYRVFNADGSEVEQCGNGARCFARFVLDKGLTDKRVIPVGTASGKISLYLEDDGLVRVDMGVPRFEPERVPLAADAPAKHYRLEIDGRTLSIGAVSMGNPHAVLQVRDVEAAPVLELGPRIQHHPNFPQQANVGFMQVLEQGHIRLRVFERGVGETLACGTGACAAVVAGILRGLLDSPVRVETRGGELVIAWAGPNKPVLMTGPAVTVFEGELSLPAHL